jgi:phosphatidylglycerol---prolipoprotein diacylglyceryl transferase
MMHPVLCKIGSISLYSWGFMVAFGTLAWLIVSLRIGKREGIKEETILDLFIYVVISAAIGARLFYVLAFPGRYLSDPISVLYLNEGGLVFIGGLCGVLIAAFIFIRRFNINIWKLLDLMSPGTMIGYSIGRIGCFLNGCCYGITLFGIQQPTQIYSSLSGIIIFVLLLYLYGRKKYDGQIFLWALLLYSIYRFLLEFLRYSPVHISVFTPNQLLAALMFVVSAYTLWKKSTT